MLRSSSAAILVTSLSLISACNRAAPDNALEQVAADNSGSDQPDTASAVSVPLEQNRRDDKDAELQGAWETVRMVSAGKELPQEAIAKDTLIVFQENQMITKRNGEVKATWTFTLDTSVAPKRMTINRAEPGEEEKLSLLIYKIEDDTLTTSTGSRSYPKSFTADTVKGCYLTVRRRTTETAMEDKLRLETVSIEPRSGDRVRVTYKVTNAAARKITRAKATVTVLDASGAEIGSESTYVVSSSDGGLEPGVTVEDDSLINVTDPQQAASAHFKIESVRGG